MWILSLLGLAVLLFGLLGIILPVTEYRKKLKEIALKNKEIKDFNENIKANSELSDSTKRIRLKDLHPQPKLDRENVIPLGMGITGVILIFPFWSLNNHLNDLITLQVNNQLVEIYQEQINDLNTEFKSIDMKAGALMNGDTPIATMVQAKVNLTAKLTEVKVLEYNANKSILERKKGGFWWIPLLVN